MNMHFSVVLMAVLAELAGALIYLVLNKSVFRTIFSIFSLGFMFIVVFMDLLLDAGMYEHVDLSHITLFAVGLCGIYLISKLNKYIGNYAAVAGLGFHNLCEGVEIAAISSLSPIVAAGFLLHKLPEGMVTFSMLKGLKDVQRFGYSLLVALLIPLGALIPISENVNQYIMSFGSGVIVMVVIKSIILQISALKEQTEIKPWKMGVAGFSGILIGAVSCLIA
jgi:Predicted divalent heavy-metal cations transporter